MRARVGGGRTGLRLPADHPSTSPGPAAGVQHHLRFTPPRALPLSDALGLVQGGPSRGFRSKGSNFKWRHPSTMFAKVRRPVSVCTVPSPFPHSRRPFPRRAAALPAHYQLQDLGKGPCRGPGGRRSVLCRARLFQGRV